MNEELTFELVTVRDASFIEVMTTGNHINPHHDAGVLESNKEGKLEYNLNGAFVTLTMDNLKTILTYMEKNGNPL